MKALLLALATSTALFAADSTNSLPGSAPQKQAEGTVAGNGHSDPKPEHAHKQAKTAKKDKTKKTKDSHAQHNVRDSKSKASKNPSHTTPSTPATPSLTPAPAPVPAPAPGTDSKP